MKSSVIVRKWLITDAAALTRVINNEAILANLRDGIPYPYTKKDAAEFILSVIAADQNSTFSFAIVFDGEVVGSIAAFRQANIHSRTAEMGYYIAEEHWGKGITTEAVRLLCNFLFKDTDILRIYA